jgi:hypothetical protein
VYDELIKIKSLRKNIGYDFNFDKIILDEYTCYVPIKNYSFKYCEFNKMIIDDVVSEFKKHDNEDLVLIFSLFLSKIYASICYKNRSWMKSQREAKLNKSEFFFDQKIRNVLSFYPIQE